MGRQFNHHGTFLPLLAIVLLVIPVWTSPTAAQNASPVASPAPSASGRQLPLAWLEFGVDGTLFARVIVDSNCPSLILDGRPSSMTVRAPANEQFPVAACEAVIPFGVTTASIGGQQLAISDGPIERIAVVGDTGCRLSDWDEKFQACNDSAAWPFAEVAASVAAWDPDLIVHVGDYLYRESPCPTSGVDCVGSPHGDNWDTWNADFFLPAAPILESAPLVVMRGNHETCSRNPDGWFRFLDPRPFVESCERFTEPYMVTLNGLVFAVMDSAEAADSNASPEEDDQYARQFELLGKMAPPGSWLVTHRPVWGIIDERNGEVEVENSAYEGATAGSLKADYALILSGHIHLAEAIAFDDSSNRPPQMIAGNSGTALDALSMATPVGGNLDAPSISEAEVLSSFGFLTMESNGAEWIAVQRDAAGTALLECVFALPQLRCEPA